MCRVYVLGFEVLRFWANGLRFRVQGLKRTARIPPHSLGLGSRKSRPMNTWV